MNPIVKIIIQRIVLRLSGTYENQVIRPYNTSVTAAMLPWIGNILDKYGPGEIPSASLAHYASSIVAPSTTPEAVAVIDNGWTQRRLLFVLVATCTFQSGGSVTYYLQGFTTYDGVSMSGAIDHNMVFEINSYMSTVTNTVRDANGLRNVELLAESGHVLANNTWRSAFEGNVMYHMLPGSIFDTIIVEHMANGFKLSGHEDFLDTRAMLTNRAVVSKRQNDRPGAWLASLLSGYTQASNTMDFNETGTDVLTNSKAFVTEPSIDMNPLFRMLADTRSMTNVSNKFKYGDLLRIDPTVADRTHYVTTGNTTSPMHQAGLTEQWTGTNRETIVATILSHSVLSLMMEHMIEKIEFVCLSVINMQMADLDIKITNARSIANIDMRHQYDMFKIRLKNEILKDITFSYQEQIALSVSADMFGETWIRVSLGGMPYIDFVTASFADSSFVPVITNDRYVLSSVSHDIDTLLNGSADYARTNGSNQYVKI